MDKENKIPDLDIYNVEDEVFQLFDNIVRNIDIPKTKFLKRYFRALIDELESKEGVIDTNTQPTEKRSTHRLRMTGVSPEMIIKLEQIAKSKGLKVGVFMRMHIYEIVQKYPENMKTPPLDY